jgi:hypothetical protein
MNRQSTSQRRRKAGHLVSPATYDLAARYRRLGLRERILTLPVKLSLALTKIGRQVGELTLCYRCLKVATISM